MDLAPKLLAAAAIVGIAGAASGAVIGLAPVLKRTAIGGERPASDFGGSPPADLVGTRDLPPDRFAIETPTGRFEVAELRDRGLHRNRRPSTYDRALDADLAGWDRSDSPSEPDPAFADRTWTEAGGEKFVRAVPASPPRAINPVELPAPPARAEIPAEPSDITAAMQIDRSAAADGDARDADIEIVLPN